MTTPGERNSNTIALITLQEHVLRLEAEASNAKEEYKAREALAEQARQKLIELMQSYELTNFRSIHGQVVLSARFTVRLPADPEAWDNFWGYLKERGHYDALRTVNHQKLNSWYKSELEAAREKGDFDFAVPGLSEPGHQMVLSFRK